jgi:catechol 2,3-dioxygenase-like lactoylglutathione lyase family enzyme
VDLFNGFDHAMIAVRDLTQATRQYRDLGFSVIAPGGRHIGRGTENNLMRFGWGWLELITVCDPVERSALRLSGDGISALIKDREGGFVDVILDTRLPDRVVDRLSRARVPVHEFSANRVRPDGLVTKNRGIVTADGSSRHLYPSFINWEQPDPERLSPETQSPHANGACEVVAISLVVGDLGSAKTAYVEVLGLPAVSEEFVSELGARRCRCAAGALTIDLLAADGPGPVRSALDSIGEGLLEVRLRVRDMQQSRVKLAELGVAMRLAPGVPNGLLLPEERTVGARIVLVE